MIDSSQFRSLVSGDRRGLAAAGLRMLLRAAETPYAWAMRRRNRRYDSRPELVHRVGVPVVSVGNLTLGGTGKTPMVRWLARWFRQHAVRVVILSRGYGAEAGTRNDEALELERCLPDVPHLQNPDRLAAARTAIEEIEAELLLLDDGFQHRRLGRELDLVMLDALEPFGYGHVFPRGLLREPIEGLFRADVVVLARADLISPDERRAVMARVEQHAPEAVQVEAAQAPAVLVDFQGREEPVERLAGLPVAAFCGIGNPEAFRRTLAGCGCRLCAWREFPDHCAYTRAHVEALAGWVEGLDVAVVLCTEKDLVKLQVDQLAGRPLLALRVEMKLLEGAEQLDARLHALLPQSRSNAS